MKFHTQQRVTSRRRILLQRKQRKLKVTVKRTKKMPKGYIRVRAYKKVGKKYTTVSIVRKLELNNKLWIIKNIYSVLDYQFNNRL